MGARLLEERWLLVPEVAKRLPCCTKRVYELIAEGKIKAAKPGKAWQIPESSVEEYLASLLGKPF